MSKSQLLHVKHAFLELSQLFSEAGQRALLVCTVVALSPCFPATLGSAPCGPRIILILLLGIVTFLSVCESANLAAG